MQQFANIEDFAITTRKKILNEKKNIITLQGDLGSGKTTFTAFLVASLGGDKAQVSSPTFNLLHIYDAAGKKIYHYDLYRLKTLDEIIAIGIEEVIEQDDNIIIIEWPSLIMPIIPAASIIEIFLKFDAAGYNIAFV